MLRLIVALLVSVAPLAHLGESAAACWPTPVPAPVARGFEAPGCPWCAGHRGVEFAPTTGLAVRAVASGVVAFAGPVAGVRYVSVDLADGRRVTYGRLSTVAVTAGAPIAAGDVVGLAGPRLLLTVRDDGEYLDPAPLLGRLVRRAWLIPTDGSAGRAPPPARLRCAG